MPPALRPGWRSPPPARPSHSRAERTLVPARQSPAFRIDGSTSALHYRRRQKHLAERATVHCWLVQALQQVEVLNAERALQPRRPPRALLQKVTLLDAAQAQASIRAHRWHLLLQGLRFLSPLAPVPLHRVQRQRRARLRQRVSGVEPPASRPDAELAALPPSEQKRRLAQQDLPQRAEPNVPARPPLPAGVQVRRRSVAVPAE